MGFRYPLIAWLAAASLPLIVLFYTWAWRQRNPALRRLLSGRQLTQLISGLSERRYVARVTLRGASVFLLLLALARPQWGTHWEETHQRGMDIIVALDSSRSMLAADVAPNRLERAKLEILALQEKARTDRFGLVAFAGGAFLQCPLTLDDAAFQQSLRVIDSNIIPQGGTAIAGAIHAAIASFDEAGEGTKVLVIVTDGEDHLDGAPEAARAAAAKGVRVFTVGVGTASGELIRIRDDQGREVFQTDENGNAVKSRLNEALLKELAEIGNGFYLPLRGGETAALLFERGLAPLPRADFQARKLQQRIERFYWPLAFAILCAVVEWFIPERRSRRVPLAKAVIAAMTLLVLAATAGASPRVAREAFEAGKFGDSQREYERMLEKSPGKGDLSYNAGTAALRAGNLREAAGHFSEAVASRDATLQQRAFYNLGNTLFQLGEALEDQQQMAQQWQRSLECFDAAIELNPADEDAKFNREIVAKRLAELPPPPEQQQNSDDKENEKKEEQKQDQESKSDQQQQKKEQQPPDNSQQPPQQQSPDPQPQNDPPKDEPQQSQPQPQQSADNQQSKPDPDGKSGETPEPGDQKPSATFQMTPQQAEAMLDARKSDEQLLIFGPAPLTNTPPPGLLKNW